MNKVLTVVVPVYNTEQYLPKCLDTLIIKDNRELLEVLIIIDGSPDNSLHIATEYSLKHPDIFRVIDKENGGHGSCCNVGIQQASGKYIKFLDSDDWFDSDSLSVLVTQLRDINVDVFFTNSIKEIVYEGRTKEYGYKFDYKNEIIDIQDLEINFSQKHPWFFSLADCGYRTDFLNEINLKFTEKVSFDDNILYLLPFKSIKKILFLNFTLYHYYIGRPEQSTSNFTPVKYTQMTSEYLKSLSVCRNFDSREFNESVMIFIKSFASNLIDSCYYSLFNSEPEKQYNFYTQLQYIINDTPILKKNKSKYHKIFRFTPFLVAKILFFARKKIISFF